MKYYFRRAVLKPCLVQKPSVNFNIIGMGLNMPAKTVVFTAVRKFDGENFRWI